MHKFTKALLISLIFSTLYNLPIIILRNSINHTLNFKIIPEFVLTSCILLLIFYPLIAFLKKGLSNFFINIFFIIGGISNYYLINFGRFIDTSAIIDVLTVEAGLIKEYIAPYLFLSIILSFSISWFLNYKLKHVELPRSSSKFLPIITTLVFILSFSFYNFNLTSLRYIMKDYLPSSTFYNIGYFFNTHLPHFKKMKDKKDLTKSYSFKFNSKAAEPLTIVLIIGESMRGDIISINGHKEYENTPLLSQIENIISFPNSISSSTSTNISLPYMLTSAIPPHFEKALNEKSIISIFKSMGFETTWIGNQGAFGFYETTYAANVLESDFHVLQEDLRKFFKKERRDIHDEHLIPILEQRLKTVKGNHFIVLHLLGSHWSFNQRYPKSFGDKFTPVCNSTFKEECNMLELKNSYHNTIVYTDYVLSEILARLKNRNAFVIYASDHGFSLGEHNLFGNGYTGENTTFEQLSIGMFSWASNKFCRTTSPIYKKILEKKFLNISHDHIFHSLLHCAGVESDYINNNLSLCK